MTRLISLCAAVIVTACAHFPSVDVAGGCEAYGVAEAGEPMGSLVVARELFQDELETTCAGSPIPPGKEQVGCALPLPDGSVAIYWRHQDRCAELHERCHAHHGGGHTAQYEHDLADGHPGAHCPADQWKFWMGDNA